MKPHHRSSSAAGGKAPSQKEEKASVPARPYAGKPLDGSQYQDVIEEQIYSEQRPRPEEEQSHRARTSQDRTP